MLFLLTRFIKAILTLIPLTRYNLENLKNPTMTMRQIKITKSITIRESASLEKYLQEISKEQLISSEEEVRLTHLIKAGDQKALDKMVRGSLRFVVSVAKQYQHQGLTLSDLINEGNLGLIKAAGRFDETRGFKFISYAVWWIRQSILEAIIKQARIVELPSNRVGFINRMRKVYDALEQENERPPSIEELAEAMGEDPEEVSKAYLNIVRQISIDDPITETTEGKTTTWIDTYDSGQEKADDGVLDESVKKAIELALGTLPNKQKEVLKMFYGINCPAMNLEAIADTFSQTKERIRQIKDQALNKLRNHKSARTFLRPYLG
jgi:RNA polymerase primary sigma factor